MKSTTGRQKLEVHEVGDMTVIHLTTRVIGDSDIHVIEDELFRLVEESGRRKLLLDFSDVISLNSRDLGRLVSLNRKLTALNGWLTLSNANEQVLEVLRVTKLTKFFDIREGGEGI